MMPLAHDTTAWIKEDLTLVDFAFPLSRKEEQEEQVQICAEGCEEEYITHIFQIHLEHNLCAINKIKQGQMVFNCGRQG